MKTVVHKADSRGNAKHGWLNSYHSFSFAHYHNPERMNFGALRVLNDDTVAPRMGFSSHPHSNMEIVSIPLEGDLEHKDSMGTVSIIQQGDIQVMSAGKGITHSEKNKNDQEEVKFLQIWVIPNSQEVEPRYDQIKISDLLKENEFSQILSPNEKDQGVWIHQNAWFYMGEFDKEIVSTYKLNRAANGLYVFVIEGGATIGEHPLDKRDGMGIWEFEELEIKSDPNSKILLMEVPMSL